MAGLVVTPVVDIVTAGVAAATAPVIAAVGSPANASGSGITTLSVSPQAVGDVLVLAVKVNSTAITVSSVSGGGVSAWSNLESYSVYAGHDLELWMGRVTATGSSSVTVTFSSSVSSISVELTSEEFSAGLGASTVWAKDIAGGQSNGSSTMVGFPSLTPTGSSELYVGYASVSTSGEAGTTSGYTYDTTGDGNVFLYDPNVSSSSAPTAMASSAGTSGAVGALVTASNASAAPTVTGVSPSTGSTAGGTTVTITGTNFTGATVVTFGTTAATTFAVNSATSITATSPAEPAWQADITVTTPSDSSATGAADKFTFTAIAPLATGTPHVMEIMMENESPADLIGNTSAPNINALAQNYGIATESYSIGHPSEPNYLEMLSGSNWGVTQDNTPQQDDISSGASTIVNQFEMAGISWRAYLESMPSAGYTGGDTGGLNQYGGDYYLQRHNPFVYFPAVTPSDLDANVVPLTNIPAMASDLDAADPPAFVWVTPNTVDDMHDGPMLPDGDTVPTLGDSWLGSFIGNIQSTSWYGAGGQIILQWDEGEESDTSGVGTAGEGGGGRIITLVVSAVLQDSPEQDAVTVNTAGVLHSVEKVYGLSYLEDAASSGNGNIDSLMKLSPPDVTGVSPSTGLTTGGTSVVITGANLDSATSVAFGGVPAMFSVNSDSSITATSPANGSGSVDVTVAGSGGTSPTGPADRFTYVGVPTVAGVNPDVGPSSGGTSVTVTGTNFAGVDAVDFGATPATGFTLTSPTSLTATAPAGTPGPVDVSVTTPGGTSATAAPDVFTYQSSGQSPGYWMVGSDGSLFSFGGAPYEGSLPGLGVHATNVVSIVPTADGRGYWMIGSDGGVFAFGDAGFVGSLPELGVHVHDVVAAVPTSDGRGYWMIGSDGGVFAFGDAGFVGSLPGLGVHVHDVVAAVPTADGRGYWMIGSDGGVFAFGDAGFVGSLPGLGVHVNDVVGAVPTSTGRGYWMVGSDGGVFAFGDAGFVGSLPGLGVHVNDVVGVVATADGKGYWMVGKDGGVFAFGDAGFVGSVPGLGIHVDNIVAFARQ